MTKKITPKATYTFTWLENYPEQPPKGYKRISAICRVPLEGGDATTQVDVMFSLTEKTWLADLELLESLVAETDLDLPMFEGLSFEFAKIKKPLRPFHEPDTAVCVGLASGETFLWSDYLSQSSALLGLPSSELPSPSTAEIQALPHILQTWELALAPFTFVGEDDQVQLVYGGMVVDGNGAIRQFQVHPGSPLEVTQILDLIARACANGLQHAPAQRPTTLQVSHSDVMFDLKEGLDAWGIALEYGTTPQAGGAIVALQENVNAEVLPYLSEASPSQIQDLMASAKHFYQLKPWEKIDGNTFMAFRFAGETWHYLNVMGQMGESFGISLYHDWLEACKLIANQKSGFLSVLNEDTVSRSHQAMQHVEAFSLDFLNLLSVWDADRLLRSKIPPIKHLNHSWYPAHHHFAYNPETEELDAAPVRFSLDQLTTLLAALTERVGQSKAVLLRKFKTRTDSLELIYPATGAEELDSRYFELQFDFFADRQTYHFCIETKGDTLFSSLSKRIWAELKQVSGIPHGHYYFDGLTLEPWNLQDENFFFAEQPIRVFRPDGNRNVPSPTVGQLADLEQVFFLSAPYQTHPIQFVLLLQAVEEKIEVKKVGQARKIGRKL